MIVPALRIPDGLAFVGVAAVAKPRWTLGFFLLPIQDGCILGSEASSVFLTYVRYAARIALICAPCKELAAEK